MKSTVKPIRTNKTKLAKLMQRRAIVKFQIQELTHSIDILKGENIPLMDEDDIVFHGKESAPWEIELPLSETDNFKAFLMGKNPQKAKLEFEIIEEELPNTVTFYLDGHLPEDYVKDFYNQFRVMKGLRPD